ncbi:MAG TPA: hypothetical protein VNG29_01415 [Candidatus Paceibacterota bacterium]|nr:hypothetical protein [Candidatus Paceibacterota bacterium]
MSDPKNEKETKKPSESVAQKIKSELGELLHAGFLVKKKSGGISKLLRICRSKVGKGATLPEFLGSVEKFEEEVDTLLWDKHALDLVTKVVRQGSDLAPVYQKLGGRIPRKMVDKKAQDVRGVTPGRSDKKSTLFEAGIGRIATDAEVERVQNAGVFELKNYTLAHPFKIEVKKQDNFSVLFVNGPHMGLEYNRVLNENDLRNLLRHAKRLGVDAIVITAGLMWMDMKKSSGRLTTHRALYSGLDFDPAVIDPEYRAEAIDIRKNLPPDKISFVTRRERVMNAFGGYKKVTSHKNGTPITSDIPVFIVFGYPEEEMIETAAHEHLRYLKTCMELDARSERKAKEAELVFALAESEGEETEEVVRLREDVQRLLRLEKRKSANTNIDPLEHKRFVPIIRTLLVSWYEKAIPNAKVVGQGTVTFEIGGKTVELSQATHDRPADDDMTDLIKSVGQRDLTGTLPDAILGAGAYNLLARWSARECMRGTESGNVQIWQLPVLIDRDYVRGAKAELMHKGSAMEKLVSNATFEPGAFILGMTDGLWDSHPLPVSMFTQRYPKTESRSGTPKEIYHWVEGDQHSGNPAKEFVWDEKTKQNLTMEVAASTIFMREFVEKGKSLPFHSFSSHGDSAQGRHFPTEQNRHPLHESGYVIEAESAEILRRIAGGEVSKDLLQQTADMLQRQGHQIRLRGEHYYQQQLEDFWDHSIRSRRRFLLEILKTGTAAKVKVRGITEILSGSENKFDRRNIGLVNWLDGNHGERTTEGTVTEGPADVRICLLSILVEALTRKDSSFSEDDLERLVKSPVWGKVASGYGRISTPGGYEWGLHLRHDPTRKSGQDGDPLKGATTNLAERGDYGFIFNKHDFITIVGDQHRYAAAYGPNKIVFNNACGTHGDSYGDDWGFSKANLGGMIICIPVEGPGAGPVRMIPLHYVFIREYLRKSWPINWDRIFPNPA